MNFRNEWDTLVDWTARYVHQPPLPPLRHWTFVAGLYFGLLSIRFIVQHRFLQRWLLYHLSGRNRTPRGRMVRRVLAEILWHILAALAMQYVASTAVFGDDAWWAHAHPSLDGCRAAFASHPVFYVWWVFTWTYCLVDLSWLLQYRRFYRTSDSTPLLHTVLCFGRVVTILFMSRETYGGTCKAGAPTIAALAQTWPVVYVMAVAIPTVFRLKSRRAAQSRQNGRETGNRIK